MVIWLYVLNLTRHIHTSYKKFENKMINTVSLNIYAWSIVQIDRDTLNSSLKEQQYMLITLNILYIKKKDYRGGRTDWDAQQWTILQSFGGKGPKWRLDGTQKNKRAERGRETGA